MRYLVVGIFLVVLAFLAADFLFGNSVPRPYTTSVDFVEGSDKNTIPFSHLLHGENIGLDCAHCHTGARSESYAYMPAKSDCMDCHRLPLTENPGIEVLDSALAKAFSEPWSKKSRLPEHVVFHHGVHASAGVQCSDCHGAVESDIYGGENFDMKMCLACHRGETFRERKFKPAATYCGACHR